jgi:putative membrane protein
MSLALLGGLAATHFGPVGFGFGWLFFLIPLFWIGLIILFASLARRRWARRGYGHGFAGPGFGGPGFGGAGWNRFGQSSGVQAAERVLAERFARGDIDETEYRARLEVLRANRDVPPAE